MSGSLDEVAASQVREPLYLRQDAVLERDRLNVAGTDQGLLRGLSSIEPPLFGSRATNGGLDSSGSSRSVALVGTYPPTECGIATFTSNLRGAIGAPLSGWETGVVRVMDHPDPRPVPDAVVESWLAGDAQSLTRCLASLNRYDVVLLQHEYGIFAGVDGQDVLELIDGLEVPLVAVLHTALRTPSSHQRAVLERVLAAASAIVVQSKAARDRIVMVHGVAPDTVNVIPHGAAWNFYGPTVERDPRPMVLTWGLLSPGKGIEHGIEAVSRLWPSNPSLRYVVAGETHPKVLAASGERYRDELRARTDRLGAGGRVCFSDGYRDWSSLRSLVRSADVVLLPYESRDQVSSGVLVEALAAGRPVVATRFPHAEELLAGGAGILADQGDIAAMAAALERVLGDPGLAERMASCARAAARPLLWPAVADSYRVLLERVAPKDARR
jgi:glycosyltransferase involved in cell wall biosynthesis